MKMIKFSLLKSDLLSVQTSFKLKYTQRCISQKNSYNYNSSFIWVNNIYSFEDLMAYKNIRMYSLQPKAKSTVRDSYWEYKCVFVYDRYVFVHINLQYTLVFYLHMKHFRSFYHSRKQIKQFIEIFFIFYKI